MTPNTYLLDVVLRLNMPSKKLTAQKRDELKKKKQKQQQKKSSGFPSFIVVLIIIAVIIAGAFFVFSNTEPEEKDTNGEIENLFAVRDFAVVPKNALRYRLEVLNNDLNLDNKEITITNITAPRFGTAEIMEGGTINYIPNENYSGHDDLLYTISDGEYESTNATWIYVADKNPFALFYTTMGDFVIELFKEEAPITVQNFIDLAMEGYYDGTIFHRVIRGFMIQGGDFTKGDGTGGHAAKYHGEGYGNPDNQDTWVIPDEFHEDLSNEVGTISMANRGPNTGSSQFFINGANNFDLDSKHPVFGRVMLGIDTVIKISELDPDYTDANNKPFEDVIINSIIIENYFGI